MLHPVDLADRPAADNARVAPLPVDEHRLHEAFGGRRFDLWERHCWPQSRRSGQHEQLARLSLSSPTAAEAATRAPSIRTAAGIPVSGQVTTRVPRCRKRARKTDPEHRNAGKNKQNENGLEHSHGTTLASRAYRGLLSAA